MSEQTPRYDAGQPTALVIDGTLPGLNEYIAAERGHRNAGARLKREWTERVAWEAKAQGVASVTGPVRVVCRWYLANRRRDLDNTRAFATKVLLDGLVVAGVLPDDSQAWVIGFQDDFALDKARPRLEVELCPACRVMRDNK